MSARLISQRLFPHLLLILLGGLAYSNSFSVPFIFDDTQHILADPRIRHLWPAWQAVTYTNRPVVDLSLAANYALGRDNPFGYHVFNLIVHLCSSLLLYGWLRRTFATGPAEPALQAAPAGPALAVAALRTVHPLLTQAVTYTIQRAESMAGLFYLLTIYCLARAGLPSDGRKSGRRRWQTLAVISCFLGMGCKEVMVTAPVVAIIYDRIFLSPSLREILRRRGRMYCGLFLSWVLLYFLATAPRAAEPVAGLTIKGLTPFNYGLTQFGVIIHYIRLVFWPAPLCFDYFSWPLVSSIVSILPQFLFIVGLLVLTGWCLRYHAFWGFWGVWFFFILAPTSSVFPITDLAFEHRMYLPSIAWLVVAVAAGQWALSRLFTDDKLRSRLGVVAVAVLIIILGRLTLLRNQVYQSEVSLWQDVLAQWPQNDRAYMSLGDYYLRSGDLASAQANYEKAVRLSPGYDKPYYGLAAVYSRMNKPALARESLRQALNINPDFSAGHYQLALLDFSDGRLEDALRHFQAVLKKEPANAAAHYNAGTVLANMGRLAEALEHFDATLRLDPSFPDAAARAAAIRSN